MATLSEHAENIKAAILAAQKDGFEIEYDDYDDVLDLGQPGVGGIWSDYIQLFDGKG